MALNFIQTIKYQKVSKNKALKILLCQTKFEAFASLKMTENEQSLQSCSNKGIEVCSSIVMS